MAPRKFHPDELKAAFTLYIDHNGQRFDLIEKEMQRLGWTSFRKECLKSKGLGENHREGLIEKHGWDKALQIHIATAGTVAKTSAESLLGEVEEIRKLIYLDLVATGVGKAGKDLIYQHDKYVQRSTEILAKLEKASDNYANFTKFFAHLVKGAMKISPALARELCDAEEPLLEWAESEFVVEDEGPKE
jgi:Ni,Fe-hydrogenase maturation factor